MGMEYVVVGLGNPGEKYAATRHNAGRTALIAFQQAFSFPQWEVRKEYEALFSRGLLSGAAVHLLLPETFMNNSGKAVKKVLKDSPPGTEVIVVYDDIDMPLGQLKISHDRGSGGHHGVNSVIAELKTRAFTRIRIGITPCFDGIVRKPKGEEAVMNFLMKPFTKEEQQELETVLAKLNQAVELFVTKGRAAAMNATN